MFVCLFVGPQTITLHPTFGSFTLLELVSHSVNWFLWCKVWIYSASMSMTTPTIHTSQKCWILVVPNVFSSSYVSLEPSSSMCSQCVPQHVPNGTFTLSCILCPKVLVFITYISCAKVRDFTNIFILGLSKAFSFSFFLIFVMS